MRELSTVIDTGVLCCWLQVPGKETAGPVGDRWDSNRANASIDAATAGSGLLILPNSVIVETARFISQADHSRRDKAQQLLNRTISSLSANSPWRRFDESARLWTRDWYERAMHTWPDFADRRVSLTDFSLISIGEFLAEMGSEVRILTTDATLSAHFPMFATARAGRVRR